MLVSLTVGKVDAGVTVLLTPDKRLIEFPSILLPPNIVSGSIVDITVARNNDAEAESDKRFAALQDKIHASFGTSKPTEPVLRCLNATQTSVVLEWDRINLATADIISLTLYRNGQKAGNIPKALEHRTTKISGLAIDAEYDFHLVLKTTAGTYTSNHVGVRTHQMTDLSGITVTMGILPSHMREEVMTAVERIGAKVIDSVRIDTTHFVTTEGRGVAWEKAVEQNIPVVRPEWVTACQKNGRLLGVTKYYLDALRPGPPSDGPTPNTTPASSSVQKDLPIAPTSAHKDESKNGTENKSGDERSEDEDKKRVDASETGDEAKAKSTDEQKMRLEDKEEQKVAIQGGKNPTLEDYHSGDDEKTPEPSPGDGASFQDVAL